jgi:adenosylcobinamide-GDP ribazoletransferase
LRRAGSSVPAERAPTRPHPIVRAGHGIARATAFLTILPLPQTALGDAPFELGAALPWFPLIGAVVGAITGAVRAGLDPLVGRGPSTVLAIAALVLITGALHQDALADTADGLGVPGDRERRLAVMRDSTLGAFGVLALTLWALLLFTALDSLTPGHALRTLIAAAATGRLAALIHGVCAPAARSDGLGAGLHVTVRPVVFATLMAAVIAVTAAGLARGALAVGVAAAVGAGSAASARRTVGGRTGDTLGAAVAVAEVCVCLALVAMWR